MLARMRAGIFRAARFLHGREFHDFDAGFVGIVQIELPFAAAADLGFFAGLPAVLDELLPGGFDVRNAQRNVIHHAERAMVRIVWDVEHVLDPVCAIGDLYVNPADLVVFPSTLPVEMEAEDVFVEVVFGGAIVDNKPAWMIWLLISDGGKDPARPPL